MDGTGPTATGGETGIAVSTTADDSAANGAPWATAAAVDVRLAGAVVPQRQPAARRAAVGPSPWPRWMRRPAQRPHGRRRNVHRRVNGNGWSGLFGLLPRPFGCPRRFVVPGRQHGNLVPHRARGGDVIFAAEAAAGSGGARIGGPGGGSAVAFPTAATGHERLQANDFLVRQAGQRRALPRDTCTGADIDQLLVVDLQFFGESVDADGQNGPHAWGCSTQVFSR